MVPQITNKSGFIPYAGDDFALLLPSKWNPSKEQDFASSNLKVELRYETDYAALADPSQRTMDWSNPCYCLHPMLPWIHSSVSMHE